MLSDERLFTSSWSFLFFKILSIKRNWVWKNVKLILFLKECPVCIGCFRLFNKIKKRSGTNFWCIFFCMIFQKNIPHLTLHQLTKFQCHTFLPSQHINENVLLSSYLEHWSSLNFRIYLQSSLKQWPTKKKMGKMEIQKSKYLKNQKNSLHAMKRILHDCLQATIWWKKWKVEDTSFKIFS